MHKIPDNVKAITELERPKNITEVQAFTGMVNYYMKFIPNLSTMLSPIYNLLKKNNAFIWSNACEKSFNDIKEELISARNLVHYDPELPVKLCTDASNVGIGSVLMHIFPNGEEKPICFASRTLSKAEENYSVIHREALAIFWSVRKFYQYLIGRHFELHSDHKPLLALFGEKIGIPQMAAGRLQRWDCFLSGFNYTMKYVKGKDNGGADGLSRLPINSNNEVNENEVDYFHFLIEEKLPIDNKQIKKETRTDPILSKVFMYTRDGWPENVNDDLKPYFYKMTEISIENDILLWGYRVLIPKKFRLRLLEELHSTHLGASKMKALARQYFWWPKLDSEVEQFSKSCDICNVYAANPNKSELVKYNECKEVGERVHADFLGPVNGKVYFIITDSYSKWPEVYPMNKIDSTSTVNKLRDHCSRYGIMKKIVTDNGAQLDSEEFQKFCNLNGIKQPQ